MKSKLTNLFVSQLFFKIYEELQFDVQAELILFFGVFLHFASSELFFPNLLLLRDRFRLWLLSAANVVPEQTNNWWAQDQVKKNILTE